MNVGELIEQLQKLDPKLTVVLQKDDEGNGYRKANGADGDCYTEDLESYWMEVVSSSDRDELIEDFGGLEEDYTQVVVLY